MSIAAVAHRFVFGMHLEANTEQVQRDMVHFVDDKTLVFPAGSNVVVFDRERNSQRFIPMSEKGEAITALAVSKDRRWLAVAERSTKPTVIIYDMNIYRKRKTLVLADDNLQATDIINMSFSGDGRYLITQTNAPDWLLTFWNWDKLKLIGSMPSMDASALPAGTVPAVYQVSFNRYDANFALVVGKNHFQCFRHDETGMRKATIPGLEQEKIQCHTWLKNGSLLLGTTDGKLLVVDGEKRMQTIERGDGAITALTTFRDGFIAACGDKKLAIYTYLMDDAKRGTFGEIYSTELPEDLQTLHYIAMSPSEQSLLCMSVTNQVCGTKFHSPKAEIEVVKKETPINAEETNDETLDEEAVFEEQQAAARYNDLFLDDALLNQSASDGDKQSATISEEEKQREKKKTQQEMFEMYQPVEPFSNLLQPLHHGRITGMDTCIRKPIIVTSSTDRSVRLWNYVDNSLVIMKYFQEDATSVAIHPSGLYLLVGFSDKLRLLSVLNDDMRLYKEYPIRNCRECRFANGGHLIAAAYGNTIHIYNMWTYENVAILKGHNGKVKSLSWSKNDDVLVSCGADGAVYGWSLRTLKRENENILKGCSYSSAVCSTNADTMFAVGSDKIIKQIFDSQITKEIASNVVFSQIVLSYSGHMMFVGTQTGAIRAIKFPLGDSDDYQEHRAHSAPVTKLCVSHDDSHLFSCSEDGCVYVFRISDKEERGVGRDQTLVFTDELLVTKSDIEEKRAIMAELKNQIEELKVANEYQMRLKDMTFSEKIRELNENFSQEVESRKITTAMLQAEKDKEDTRHVQEFHVLKEERASQLHQQETIYNQKLMAEFEKLQELQHRSRDLQEEWESRVKEKEALHQQALSDLTDDNEAKMRMKVAELVKLQEEMHQQRREFNEIRKQMEEDIDAEIQSLESKYDKRLRTSHDEGLRLKGENGIMKKKFNTLYKEIEDMNTEKVRLSTEQVKLNEIIRVNENESAVLKKEIQERDEFIQNKEKRVYELKKSNQELEKFKFVLDYKIRDLKKQIEPKENDIAEMSKHIYGLSKELEDYYARNLSLEKAIEESKKVLQRCKKTYLAEKQKSKNVNKVVDTFKADLESVMDHFQASPDVLQTHFRRLYKKYMKDASTIGDDQVDREVKQEVARQNHQLEHRAYLLREQSKKNILAYKRDDAERIKENERIIRELTSIRKETKLRIKSQDIKNFQKQLDLSRATLPSQQTLSETLDSTRALLSAPMSGTVDSTQKSAEA